MSFKLSVFLQSEGVGEQVGYNLEGGSRFEVWKLTLNRTRVLSLASTCLNSLVDEQNFNTNPSILFTRAACI